ncbi:MAG TPA: DUF6077 domain-containing protein [Terriglobales bacterium]
MDLSKPRRDVPSQPGNLPPAVVLATLCPAFAFAFWTLWCHVCVLWRLSFRTLADIGPAALAAGCACGVLVFRAGRTVRDSESIIFGVSRRPAWICLAVAAGIVVARQLGMGYPVFWIACVLLLSCALTREPGGAPISQAHPTGGNTKILVALMLVAPVLTYVAHRPDIDDAVYVGTAADALAHPDLPVLSHDVLYGNQKFPLMLPSYSVETYELLIASATKWLGGSPIFWAHAVFPTAIAVLVPIAWACLMRILVPRHWGAATVLALVALLIPADFRGLGNFAFVGLSMGKAILMSVGVPLLYASVWNFQQTGLLSEWLTVAALSIGCVGLSASAIFVVPLVLTVAGLAGWQRGRTARTVLALAPILYPLICGLSIFRAFKVLAPAFARLPAYAHLAIPMVLGARTQYLYLFALLSAAFFQNNQKVRRQLLIVVLAYFLVALNPFTFKLLSRLTTRDAEWRVLWCVPVAGIVAAAIMGALQMAAERWPRAGLAAALVVFSADIGCLPLISSLSPSNGVSYSLRPLKVIMPDYEFAAEAVAATPASASILAPEEIAVWIPTFVHRPPMVSIREIYDEEMGTHLAPEEARERRDLRELVSGTQFPVAYRMELLNALPAYSVGLIVATRPVADQLEETLLSRGFARAPGTAAYVLFRKGEAATLHVIASPPSTTR